MALATQLRNSVSHTDPGGLNQHIAAEIKLFEDTARERGCKPEAVLAALPAEALAALGNPDAAPLDSETAAGLLGALGIGAGEQGLPARMAPLLALIAAMPAPLTERLLIELLARLIEPQA